MKFATIAALVGLASGVNLDQKNDERPGEDILLKQKAEALAETCKDYR